MDTELVQMEELLELFEEREQAIKYTTFKIFDKIQTPVLETLMELFDVPSENVEWNDIHFISGALLMICTITYNPNDMSPFIEKLFVPSPEEYQLSEVTKMMRVGVPITHAFKSKEEIKTFLNYIINQTTENLEDSVEFSSKIKDNTQLKFDPSAFKEDIKQSLNNNQLKFDTSNLTEEQLIQLALYKHQGRGAKH